MNNVFILTGYDKKANSMMTRIIKSIDDVYSTIQYFSPEALTDGSKKYASPRDLEFDVQSRRSHNGAVIIYANDFCWSIIMPK